MSEYPNYTLEQLAQLILKLDMKEGVSPAGLGALQMFAKSALENASQHSVQADGACTCANRHIGEDHICVNCGGVA